MPASHRSIVVRNLAAAALDGPWTSRSIAGRFQRAITEKPKWLAGIAKKIVAAFPDGIHPSKIDALAAVILEAIAITWARSDTPGLTIRELFVVHPVMQPAHGWPIPMISTAADVAAWLGLTTRELDWFADVQGRNHRQPQCRLRHYTHRWVAKKGGRYRLLEVPKSRLKAIQRTILQSLLNRIPCHEAAHGFRFGRSVQTFVSPHVGRAAVWRIDLKDFFPSIAAARVRAIFVEAGYPTEVAQLLTGLCTTRLAAGVKYPDASGIAPLYDERHLPQGAPTSPALANLAAYRLDVRLASWAAACGANYTRDADDLAFSGQADFAKSGPRFRSMVFQIILEEGFRPNAAKSRWMTHGGRQQLAGVVVNCHPNVRRDDYDRLKAILTNCARLGPGGQNRDHRPDFRAYLRGKVAHVTATNATRGERLMAIFDAIAWPDSHARSSPREVN